GAAACNGERGAVAGAIGDGTLPPPHFDAPAAGRSGPAQRHVAAAGDELEIVDLGGPQIGATGGRLMTGNAAPLREDGIEPRTAHWNGGVVECGATHFGEALSIRETLRHAARFPDDAEREAARRGWRLPGETEACGDRGDPERRWRGRRARGHGA